jgi:hypothetical protein
MNINIIGSGQYYGYQDVVGIVDRTYDQMQGQCLASLRFLIRHAIQPQLNIRESTGIGYNRVGTPANFLRVHNYRI